MEFTQLQLDTWIASLVLSFTRIAALLIAAPLFGGRSLPVRIRMSFALVLAMMVLPILPPAPPLDLLSFAMVLAVGRELLIGVMAGFVLQLVFAALAIAGEVIALGMGLGFASLVDPDKGVQVPVVGQLLVIMATLLFLAMDGHLALISFMVLSFTGMPIGGGLRFEDFAAIAGWGSVMFGHAVMIALPAVGALLLANISMGVVTRAAPQLNIFAVGFPMTLMLGFVLLYITVGAIGSHFAELLAEGFGMIGWLLGG
jgi:flagellar biosynthesis protein FliR